MHWLLIFLGLFLLPMGSAFALAQHEKAWVGATVVQPITADQRWNYLLYTQSRFINESHPWQSTLFEGGIGYRIAVGKNIWAGYRFGANNPNNGFFQEHRLWQAFDTVVHDADRYILYSRSRLEESYFGNQSQVAWRLRQRMLLLGRWDLFAHVAPEIYDELFFQLNRTVYTSHVVLSENRLFLGVRLFTSGQSYWEVGYLNQYLMNTPLIYQNQMNHVIFLNYSYV